MERLLELLRRSRDGFDWRLVPFGTGKVLRATPKPATHACRELYCPLEAALFVSGRGDIDVFEWIERYVDPNPHARLRQAWIAAVMKAADDHPDANREWRAKLVEAVGLKEAS